MANSGIFSSSYIERDLGLTGGERVISKIFDKTLDLSGIIVATEGKYVLIAEIVPDQSRIFREVSVRINGMKVENYKIYVRADGKKVIGVIFELSPKEVESKEFNVDVVWNYTDEDLARPEVFRSTVEIELGNVLYDVKEQAPGVTVYKGAYGIQSNDFFKQIGTVTLNINPLTIYYSGLSVRYYPNYKDYPNRYEVMDFDNKLSDIPFQLKKKIFVDLDTLKVQNKKFDLIWRTQQGDLIETIMVDTDTIGYATGFSAPVPIEICEDAYPGIDLRHIYRNFVFQPEYCSYYKGDHELKGRNLSFRTKLPIELSLLDFKLQVLVNDSEVGYTTTPSSDNQYNFVRYDVPLSSFGEVKSVEVRAMAVYPNAVEVNYGVVFTGLF